MYVPRGWGACLNCGNSNRLSLVLVLIDESGDPGFKLVRGSSSHFVVAMVIFEAFEEAERASSGILELRNKRQLASEFKFSKCHDDVKDAFFECVCRFDFKVRAIVVDKSIIYSDNLRTRKDLFYNYFVQQLMRYGELRKARVKIDGSGDRKFKDELNSYLRRNLSQDQLHSVKFAESHRDNLIQLADMVSGAILRSYRACDRKQSDKWLRALQRAGRVDNIWPFR